MVTVFNMIAVPCFVYQVTPVYACIESLFRHKILCMQSVAKLSLVQGAVGLLGERLHKLDEL